jgi:hypothetical protein
MILGSFGVFMSLPCVLNKSMYFFAGCTAIVMFALWNFYHTGSTPHTASHQRASTTPHEKEI